MKNNFKKLTRNEQLMVNGGAFGPILYCSTGAGNCTALNIPNGNPCQTGGTSGALICSGLLGGGASAYKVGNERACVC